MDYTASFHSRDLWLRIAKFHDRPVTVIYNLRREYCSTTRTSRLSVGILLRTWMSIFCIVLWKQRPYERLIPVKEVVKKCRIRNVICLSVYLSIYDSTALVKLGRFFSFFISYTVGSTPWMGDQPVSRPLPAYRTAQTQNKCTQTSMLQVGFEPTYQCLSGRRRFMPLPRGYCDQHT
jgi:hypothetical protein